MKIIFVKLRYSSGYSKRITSKRPTCQKEALLGKLSPRYQPSCDSTQIPLDSVLKVMNQGKFRRICMESSMWITSIWALKCFQKMHSLTNYYFLLCQNYWEVNITCCLNDSSSRSLSEANLWLSRRTSRSASSPCKVIVCVMLRSNSNVLINKTYRPREWSILHWL